VTRKKVHALRQCVAALSSSAIHLIIHSIIRATIHSSIHSSIHLAIHRIRGNHAGSALTMTLSLSSPCCRASRR
jgi:uncharacterized membrane protein required for colicin V production